MSEARFLEARKSPFFRWGDLVIYAILAALIVGMFFLFGFRSGKALTGVQVLRDDTVVFTYDFITDTFTLSEGVSVEETEGGYLVTIRDGEDWNILSIDKSGSVRMADANCSLHKDCVYMREIKDDGGVILCVPHHLKVSGMSEDIDDPVIG
ncbi:MAG: NusG domain II-containing protein [Christensenellaceae bacterium]